MGLELSGFRGFGSRVQGSGPRVPVLGLGYTVLGLEVFGFRGFGSRVRGFEPRVDIRFHTSGAEMQTLGAEIQPWRPKSSPGSSNPALGAQI